MHSFYLPREYQFSYFSQTLLSKESISPSGADLRVADLQNTKLCIPELKHGHKDYPSRRIEKLACCWEWPTKASKRLDAPESTARRRSCKVRNMLIMKKQVFLPKHMDILF